MPKPCLDTIKVFIMSEGMRKPAGFGSFRTHSVTDATGNTLIRQVFLTWSGRCAELDDYIQSATHLELD